MFSTNEFVDWKNCCLTYSHVSSLTVNKKLNALNILHQATDSLVETLVSVLLTTGHKSMTAAGIFLAQNIDGL